MQHLSKQTLSRNARYVSKAFLKTVFHGENGPTIFQLSPTEVTNASLESLYLFSPELGSICAKKSTLSWLSVH